MKAASEPEPKPRSSVREARVAAALRENLRKRKAQQQDRAASAFQESRED